MVLVVEDDPDNLDSMVELLQDEGYQVISARSGKEAREQLDRNLVQVVITDYLLPDMTGADLVVQLQQRLGPPVPVIFLTGMQQPPLGDAAGTPVLRKPVILDDLLAMVGRCFATSPPPGPPGPRTPAPQPI